MVSLATRQVLSWATMEVRAIGACVGAAAIAVLLASGCGGGATSPTGATRGGPTSVVALDAGNFEALVIGSTRPSLVEFHSPT
jgi:hypothetical protein